MNNNLTVFQKLSRAITPSGGHIKTKETQRYNLGKDVLLKTENKEEYEKAKLQAKQSKYLGQLWKRVDSGIFQQTVNYETRRIASYSDFEAMEFYPEIAAALDTYAEESTTLGDTGKMVNVYSDNDRIKSVIEDLLYNRLDLHISLPMWTRNVCKYGNSFLFLNIDEKDGITGARQMPNYEMDRYEGDMFANSTESKLERTRFYWRGGNVEFKSWQIAHFRMLSDDRLLPYGSSMLEKVRSIWKRLLMAEDAMLVYRVTRAPERRVFKIYVGNIDDADVGAYVDEIANRFKRTQVIDPQTGQVDLKFNHLQDTQDFFIPVRNPTDPSPIETLPGATNLDAIQDLVYLLNKLYTGLRIPKSFLGFSEAAGDGKNLAMQDIRFSRTVNRIQQCMLQELNKIVIIHLLMSGFEDELNNFTLTMNNPSTQAEMLKIEHMQSKVTLFKDAVTDTGNGFAPMSITRGWREIFGWSDNQIKSGLLEQRMERAAAAELANSASVIKHTGMFDIVDRVYGDMELALKGGGDTEVEGDDKSSGGSSGGGLGGGFGGGGVSPEDLDFGSDDETGEDEPKDENAEASTEDEPKEETISENLDMTSKILNEKRIILNKKLNERIEKYKGRFYSKLLESVIKKENETKIYNKTSSVNKSASAAIRDIDKILNE